MNKIVFAVVVLALCSLSFAENPGKAGPDPQRGTAAALAQKNAGLAAPHSPFSTSTCSFTFTSGSFDTFLKYCVTANGNITQLEAPQHHEHIAVGDFSEGYGFCDFSSSTSYFDYADSGDSANWGPPSLVKQNTRAVKIARTTTDGVWTLTQTITQIAGNSPYVTIAMALRNNSTTDRSVQLMRFVDVDVDGQLNNELDATHKAAFGWNSFGLGHAFGLQLFSVGKTSFDHAGFVLKTASGPAPCNPFTFASFTALTNTDGSLVHIYDLRVPKGTTKTVTVGYKSM